VSVLLSRLVLAALFLVAAAPARAQDPIRIATEGAYPPFNYVENNEAAGFEVDLARALCTAMGAPCTFVLQDWDGMIPGLRENRYDAIMSSMEITRSAGRKSRSRNGITASLPP
jgi:ABC-type amino acid transport substrate-binding protein